MWIKKTLAALTEDFRGKSAGLVIGYLLLSVLFLVYIYAGKKSFLSGRGYGIPSALAVSSSAGADQHRKLGALLREQRSLLRAGKRAAVEKIGLLNSKIAKARRSINRLHVTRMRQIRFLGYGGWYFSSFFILFFIPLLFILLHPRIKPGDFGLGLGDWRLSLRVFALFTGVMLVAVAVLALFRVKGFLRYYPMFAKGLGSDGSLTPGWFLLLELLYLFYFIGWEFYFRSLIIFPLEKHLGSLAALAGVLPFAIMHVGKPVAEAFGSIVAAYFLGVLVLKTRSFWICAVLHFLIAFSMDLAAVISRGLI